MLNIDILLIVGGKSGFELALNRTADCLSKHDCRIRFVQLKYTGVDWATSNASFFCFNTGDYINFEDNSNNYCAYIKANGAPDIIIAAGMPAAIYIARKTLDSLNNHSCPIISWPHNDLYYFDPEINNTKDALSYANIHFAMSDKIACDIRSLLPDALIYRVNNTIDTSKINYSEDRGSQKLVYIGRLSKEKNIPLILNAISIASSNWELKIIGDGNERESLEALCCSLGLEENEHFLGWVDNPYAITTDTRSLIIASNSEGSPLVIPEALVCGMSVISTPVATAPEIIEDGINGYLYSFDAPDELAAILDKMSQEHYHKENAIACKNSAADFMPDVALWDFFCKLHACKNLIGLPQRYWEDKKTDL